MPGTVLSSREEVFVETVKVSNRASMLLEAASSIYRALEEVNCCPEAENNGGEGIADWPEEASVTRTRGGREQTGEQPCCRTEGLGRTPWMLRR